MKKRTFTPISVLIGVLLLALAAAMTTFVADSNIAHAQTASGITVGGKSLANFAAGTYDYTSSAFRVSSTTTHVTVSASPGAGSSVHSIKYLAGDLSNSSGTQTITDVGGTAVTNNSVPLRAGESTDVAFLMVTGNNPTTAAVYVVRVTRVSSGASSDATLTGLTITNPTVTLVPGFSSSVESYTAFVPYDVDDGQTGNDSNDEITVNPTPATNATAKITSNKDSTIGSNNVVELVEGQNVITISVEAENVVSTKTYTVTIRRAAENASDDARLSSLTVGGKAVPSANIELSDGNDETVDYITKVSFATSSVQVSASKKHPGANVVIRTSESSASESVSGTVDTDGRISLTAGTAMYIAVQVTAEDGKSTNRRNYILQVTRVAQNASSVATLSGLTLNDGNADITNLAPTFASSVESYTAFVPYDVDGGETGNDSNDEITVTPTTTDTSGNATFTIKPDDSNTTTNGHQVELAVGRNTITVMVEAADVVTKKTYTITVTRAAETGSDDARLSSLTVAGEAVSTGGLNGADEIVDYTTIVPNATRRVQVNATAMDSNAVVVIRTAASAADADTGNIDADGRIDLVPGTAMYIGVQVTAPDGETVRTYIAQVTRALATASDDATLTGLTITNPTVTLVPGFDSDTVSYTAFVPYDVDDGQTGNDSNDEITVNPTHATGATTKITPGDSNTASGHQVELAEGQNVITITVKAADALAMKTYAITVTRAAENASDDASLKSLTVGGNAVSLPLPAYDSSNAAGTTYVTGVSNAVSSIQVTAAATHSGAKVVIRRGGSATAAAATTGTVVTDGQIPLIVGYTNFVAVHVTAEDGKGVSEKTYMLKINRSPARASSDTKLAAAGLTLTVPPTTLTPTFDPDKMKYTAEVDSATTQVTVTATGYVESGNDNNSSTVRITSDTDDDLGNDSNTALNVAVHPIDLVYGANVITISVTAADYEATSEYEVTVTRPSPADDATLSGLSLTDMDGTAIVLNYTDSDGAAMTGFMSAIMEYTATADNIEKVTVMPTALNSSATYAYTDADGAALSDVDDTMDGDQFALTDGENTVKVVVTSEDGTETKTYTVVITVSDSLKGRYDANDNGVIEKSELVTAIGDYLYHGTLTKKEIVELIQMYLGVGG